MATLSAPQHSHDPGCWGRHWPDTISGHRYLGARVWWVDARMLGRMGVYACVSACAHVRLGACKSRIPHSVSVRVGALPVCLTRGTGAQTQRGRNKTCFFSFK